MLIWDQKDRKSLDILTPGERNNENAVVGVAVILGNASLSFLSYKVGRVLTIGVPGPK